jgi:hypothetical protein
MTRFDALNQIPFFQTGTTPSPIINFGAVGNHAPVLSTSTGAPPTSLSRFDLVNTAGAGATKSATVTKINVTPFTAPPLAAQPDGTRAIGLIDQRFKSNVYQVGNVIYACHDVTVGDNAAIKWYKIDEATNQLIQEGIICNPYYDYYQGSMAANADGDVVIGFNRSGLGPDGQISIFAIHGSTQGNVTTFGTPFLLKASEVDNYHYTNTRWGDYTTTVVDPLNPKVFWTFQEYALAELAPGSVNWAWATHVSQIFVPEPESVALAAMALAALVATVLRRHQGNRWPGKNKSAKTC